MNDRMFLLNLRFSSLDGALTGNVSHVFEFSQPWVFDRIKHSASNASTATFTVAGGVTISATDLGDSGNPTETQDDSAAPVQVAADTAVTLTLDFNGAGATAAQNANFVLQGFMGEGPQ